MMSEDTAIKISDVHVSFGNHHVLKGASGEIKKEALLPFWEEMAAANLHY